VSEVAVGAVPTEAVVSPELGAPVEPGAIADPIAPPPTGEVPSEPMAAVPPVPAPPAETVEQYAALVAEAEQAMSRGRQRDAEQAYRRAIDLNPQGGEALAQLAWLEVNRGRYPQAAELGERAVAADPTNAQAWLSLGAAKQVLGDREGSRAALARCIENGGTSRWARYCRQM